MNFQSKGLVLLTGAGFTKNFGGFLAIEMWSKVFNHPEIQSSEKLKSLIQNNFNYENIYSDVLNNSKYDVKNKQIIEKAVIEAYNQIDCVVSRWTSNVPSNDYSLNIDKIKKFLQILILMTEPLLVVHHI